MKKKFEKPYRFLKGSKDFLTQKKSQVKTIGPLPDMLRISLRGIKHFEAKKVDKHYRFLKSNIPLLTQNSINEKGFN